MAPGGYSNRRNDRQRSFQPYDGNRRRVGRGSGFVHGKSDCGVFVGNLSWRVAWQDLKDHFKQIGEVVHAEVMTEHGTGRSKGCGTVLFRDPQDAIEAVEKLNESELEGRVIFVKLDGAADQNSGLQLQRHEPSTHESYKSGRTVTMENQNNGRRLFVGNLDFSVDWKLLKDHLKPFGGDLRHVDIAVHDDGRSKGYGIAEYGNSQDAMDAMRAAHNTELLGRLLNVREDREGGEYQSNGDGPRDAPMGHSRNNGSRSRNNRLFVQNLSWDVEWQDLKDFMRRAGNVTYTDVAKDDEGRSRGFGFVEYETAQEARDAIDMLNDVYFRGRNIFIREDREERN